MQQSHAACRSTLSICLLAVIAIALPRAVFSQVLTGVISGTVTDATQAVVPNAAVTIVNADTGVVAWHGDTNESGLYRAPSLPAGRYNVSVQLQPELIGGIRVVVGDEVLDTSVKARLEQMKAALTA